LLHFSKLFKRVLDPECSDECIDFNMMRISLIMLNDLHLKKWLRSSTMMVISDGEFDIVCTFL